MSQTKDPFAQVPEFLAAFQNVLDNGFLLSFKVDIDVITDDDNQISKCVIEATGAIPNNETYMAKGCGAICDPKSIVEACRQLTQNKAIKLVKCKIETEDWPIWDKAGQKMIGSKGQHKMLTLHIWF